jgi:hypothetical protein
MPEVLAHGGHGGAIEPRHGTVTLWEPLRRGAWYRSGAGRQMAVARARREEGMT